MFGAHMRRWREDRLLRVVEVAGMLDVEEDVLAAWEDGVGLPEDTQEVAMRYRSLQTAAGEEHRDFDTPEGRVYGITVGDVQKVWERYMNRVIEREQARVQHTPVGQQERDQDMDQGEAPEDVDQTYRRGGGRPRQGFRRRR